MNVRPFPETRSFLNHPEFQDEFGFSDESELNSGNLSPDFSEEFRFLEMDEGEDRGQEINRRNLDYIRWVQNSLNLLLGTRLAADGIMGPRTRRAVREFQRRKSLRVDGIVGPQTERALIAGGAGPIPRGASITGPGRNTGPATLADFHTFTRRFVREFISSGRTIDCADLAIELWIRFGRDFRIPVSFRIWNSVERQFRSYTRRQFRSTSTFLRHVQRNLGARGLIRNTYPVPGGHRAAVAGDIYLWQYFNQRTNRPHRWGHTQVLYEVVRGTGGPATDRIRVVQGSLPPIIPVFRLRSASYFQNPRTVNLTMNQHRELHIGRLVGTGPRRFRSFRNFR